MTPKMCSHPKMHGLTQEEASALNLPVVTQQLHRVRRSEDVASGLSFPRIIYGIHDIGGLAHTAKRVPQ